MTVMQPKMDTQIDYRAFILLIKLNQENPRESLFSFLQLKQKNYIHTHEMKCILYK